MINLDFLGLMLLALIAVIILSNTEKIKRFFRKFLSGSRDTESYVKLCPKCGSTKIAVDFSNPVIWNYGTPPKYRCKSCSFIGTIFPEIIEQEKATYEKEFRQKLKEGTIQVTKSDLFDASTGYSVGIIEAYLAIISFLFIPLVFFYGESEYKRFIAFFSIMLSF